MKCALLIIDGLGDLPVEKLGGMTPLEAARTPWLDAMASAGFYGLLDPVMPGVKPNTHSGAGMLLGMRPGQSDTLPRGVVEAAGLGLSLQPGDIAFRSNFATLERTEEALMVIDRRAGRIQEHTAELADLLKDVDLCDGVTASLYGTDQHRAVLLLNGPGLDVPVSDTDPGDIRMPAAVKKCMPGSPSAQKTAEKVNDFLTLAYKRLSRHPVNLERSRQGKLPASGIITRGAGAVALFDNGISDLGIRAAVVAGCNTVKGLGRLFGFRIYSDHRFTASVDTDLDAKIAAVLSALEHNDLVYLHIKAPDLCAHDRRPDEKMRFIERMDQALEPLMQSGAMIAVTADHTTDSNSGFHTSDPVPALLYVPGRKNDSKIQFSERSCRDGNLSRRVSDQFLKLITDMMAG